MNAATLLLCFILAALVVCAICLLLVVGFLLEIKFVVKAGERALEGVERVLARLNTKA